MRAIRTLLWVAVASLAFGGNAFSADCEFNDGGKRFSVEGAVVYVDTAVDVAGYGHKKVVAILDKKRGCVAYIQAHQAPRCSKGKTAAATGTTFVVPFTPVVLAGADSVRCR